MQAEKRTPHLHGAPGVVLAALLSCAIIFLLALASARAAEARTGRQAWTSTGTTALATMEGGDVIAVRADAEDCHGEVAASECCAEYCPFAIFDLPAAPVPPSARRPLPTTAFAGDYQTGVTRPDEPPRRGSPTRLHAAERA